MSPSPAHWAAMSDPTGERRHGKLGGEEAEPDVDDMSVEELRAAVRQLREQRRRDLDTIESLRLPLLTELAGGGGAVAGGEAGAADVGEDEMTKHAAAVEGRLQETIEAVQEVTAGWDTGYDDDDEDWRCADYCVAGSCVLFNLLFGIMMASLAAAMLMSQHPSSPCRAGTAEGGWDVGGCARTLAYALATREPPPIAPTVCKHIGTALGPPALQLLQSGSLCASGEEGPAPPAPPPFGHDDPRGMPMLSMRVQRGGFRLFGRRWFSTSHPLAIWRGEDPSQVAQRWVSQHGGQGQVKRGEVVRLITEAARSTGVIVHLSPLASLPIQLGETETTPLLVFEGDDPEAVARWYHLRVRSIQTEILT